MWAIGSKVIAARILFEERGFGNEVGLWFYGENEDYYRTDTWHKVENEIEQLQKLKNELITE